MLLYCILDKWLCGKLPYHEALDFQDELEREQAERMSPSKEYENCQDLFFWRHDGVYQPLLVSAEYGCQEKGYASSCLVRGLLALEHGEKGKDPEEAPKIAEEYFQKGCTKDDLPVCRLITETRRDDSPRDNQDEERIITGILMMGCDMGSEWACGDAAIRFFNEGDYNMARNYSTRGCVMKDRYGNSIPDPRSCQLRKLTLKMLAETAAGTSAVSQIRTVKVK